LRLPCYKVTMGVKVVFFDCDGTLTEVKSSWQYLHERLGLWDENADEYQRLFREGRIDYHEFCRRDAKLWKGLPESRILGIMEEIEYRQGVREAMATLSTAGILTVILSTGLASLVDRAKRDLGMTYAVANELIMEGGVVTGGVRINVDHDRKDLWVRKILKRFGLERDEAAAVGDGEGDLGMFEEVGLTIGCHPNEKIAGIVDHVFHNGSFIDIVEMLKA
jgi:phosphoserine phosphatase